MSHYRIINHGQVSGFIGVRQDFIDNRIKVITAEKIRELKFDNGSYIWVNEIAKKHISSLLLIFIAIVFSSLGFLVLLKNWDFKKQKHKIEQENKMDLLTTAFNRKYGTNELKKAFTEYEKNGNSPAIMMFDIDNFKHVNDTFGHAAGDQVLKEIINVVCTNIRNTDKLIRWGGDEFVCICYGLTRENAMSFGQKLLSSVASMNILFESKTVKITISIGFSYIEKNDRDIFEVVKRADDAMYKSKEQGRNTVNLL